MRAAAGCLLLALAWPLGGCFGDAAQERPIVAAASEPHPNSINGLLSRPWRHKPNPVSAQQQSQDEAKCKMLSGMTAAGNDEIRYLVNYINCLRASGYEPDPPKQQ